ncbi:PD-(D/E)XK nuclease family protein [Methanobrevibacter sp.]|uniref:PD-(D/E)XK nuclease family protein n=1 Tax=Methanobrevibacter sp. TaxID=66852 RepID=UPI0026E111EF|nr:PD-(D/E)XK nuclease family protein [Methanobrevibacter sp.]
MKLSARSDAYIIPEYSLTGDLLSFLTCNLQYRYQNRGTLPPSMPVQLWFGEFIHGVMEEAFLEWENTKKQFPWDWKEDVRPIEDMIDLRLQVRGLYPPKNHFFTTNSPDSKITSDDINAHDHKKLASARAHEAINTWGPHLFPLIDSAELLIKGLRNMPNYDEKKSRSNYYGINGVIDVLSSIKIDETIGNNQSILDNYTNKIIEFLKKDTDFQKNISEIDGNEYEIIIDYKGMKRPSTSDKTWEHHKQQILTYSWLRSKQEDAKPIVAGIIFYLNELVPSYEDLQSMQIEIENDQTDIEIGEEDFDKIMNWDKTKDYPQLSDELKEKRSFRIITINEDEIDNALEKFDAVVYDIEKSIIDERDGCNIKQAWKAEAEERTCNACDFKTFCGNEKNKKKNFKIP